MEDCLNVLMQTNYSKELVGGVAKNNLNKTLFAFMFFILNQ